MSNDNRTFLDLLGKRIRNARKRRGLSQADLGQLMGVSQNVISRYERGERSIGVEDIPLLASVLQLSPSYFFDTHPSDDELNSLDVQLHPLFYDIAILTLDAYVGLQKQLTELTLSLEEHGGLIVSIDPMPTFQISP